MPHPEVQIVATMAETGRVHIFDISQQFASFDTPGLIPPRDPKPIHSITNHGAYEGYAVDWSPLTSGSLLTGDGKGRIFLTKKDSASFTTEKKHFAGHTSSVEDIQWSPSQSNVFASCSADQVISFLHLDYLHMGFTNNFQTTTMHQSPRFRCQCYILEQKSRLPPSIRIRFRSIFDLGFKKLANSLEI